MREQGPVVLLLLLLGVYENDKGKVDTGLYCSGWAKTGPVGVIAATLNSSQVHISLSWVGTGRPSLSVTMCQ